MGSAFQFISVTSLSESEQLMPNHLQAGTLVFQDGCGFVIPEIKRARSYS